MAAAFCVVPLGLPTARAQTITGTQLYQICTSEEDTGKALCQGWTGGFLNALVIAQVQADRGKKGAVTCLPNGVTGIQVKRTVMKFLADHPSLMNEDAGVLTFFAIKSAFPCPSN
jgi:Rap1a immunity proteins